MDRISVRARCAVTCGCGSALPSLAGFFQTQAYGCPGGCMGHRAVELESISCVNNSISTALSSSIWGKYVHGMQEYFLSQTEYSQHARNAIIAYQTLLNITTDQAEDVHAFLVGNGFWDALADHRYLLGEGIPHPSGKIGCDFLASSEVLLLLNLDICDIFADFLSLKPLCPLACECTIFPRGCP